MCTANFPERARSAALLRYDSNSRQFTVSG